jgi:hypothetical protein
MSSSETVAHFGLGKHDMVDTVRILWLDGSSAMMTNVKANQVLKIAPQRQSNRENDTWDDEQALFTNITEQTGIDHHHRENEFDDYAREILLPYELSHLGPCIVTGDVNGDNFDDFYVGGAAGYPGALFIQADSQKFTRHENATWEMDQQFEDTGAEFFDADSDGDLDLYVVSGGNEFEIGSQKYQDRLYINDGNGRFSRSSNRLPAFYVSGGVVKASDFDGDGDEDLFVGGRQVPGKYGFTPESYILRNDGKVFTDVTEQVAPFLKTIGMVTDAGWFDFDEDGYTDLVVVGEWMPITWIRNVAGKFEDLTEEMGFANSQGWWNRIQAADFDQDGDLDFAVGNLGLNIKYKASETEPFRLYADDFDKNGTHDVYLGYYDEDGICYPVRGRECSSQQLPYILDKYPSYDLFAKASIENVLGELSPNGVKKEAKVFSSSYIMNDQGAFTLKSLPSLAQIAPINGIIAKDWNADGLVDLFIAGNYYEREVETTRSDAGFGQILLFQQNGTFKSLHPKETGLIADKNVRAIGLIEGSGKPCILIANNNDKVEIFTTEKNAEKLLLQ